MEKTYDAAILANGDFPSHAAPLRILRETPHVIACDGAIAHYPQAEVVIGDGDSVPPVYYDRLVHVDEQDDNDLTKATRYCLRQGWHRIAYIGCTGRREDHTLGNISLLMRYFRDMAIDAQMFTDHGCFTPAKGAKTFDSIGGQQVSIFNFGCTTMRSEGLRWNCYSFDEWWQGTLNEALGDTFTIHADGHYLVYQTYETKKAK